MTASRFTAVVVSCCGQPVFAHQRPLRVAEDQCAATYSAKPVMAVQSRAEMSSPPAGVAVLRY